MKNLTKVMLSVLLVCILCISLISTTVAAADISHSSTEYGGGSATVFYVKTTNTNKATLRYSSTAGRLSRKDGTVPVVGKYGYFEVLVYGKKSNGQWVQISKTNMKNSASSSISMKGYKEYKVRVYSWKTSTIGTYIGGKYNSSAHWVAPYLPTCYFTANSKNISSIRK